MARYVVITPVTIAPVSYAQPGRILTKQQTVELSAAEVTAIGAGNLRATVARDALGVHAGVANSD